MHHPDPIAAAKNLQHRPTRSSASTLFFFHTTSPNVALTIPSVYFVSLFFRPCFCWTLRPAVWTRCQRGARPSRLVPGIGEASGTGGLHTSKSLPFAQNALIAPKYLHYRLTVRTQEERTRQSSCSQAAGRATSPASPRSWKSHFESIISARAEKRAVSQRLLVNPLPLCILWASTHPPRHLGGMCLCTRRWRMAFGLSRRMSG